MQDNPASKTVRTLSIVVIILAVLGIVAVLLTAAAGVLGVVVYSADEVQSQLANSTWEDVLGNAEVEMTASEQEELADAICTLESLDNDQVEPLIQLFKGFGEGDISALQSLLVDNDTTEVMELIGALASLSDSDIATLANEIYGVSEKDLKELRDNAKSVTAEDIEALQTFVSETTPQDVANTVMGTIASLGVGVLGFILVAVIFSLVAGILALRNAFDPQSLGGAFVVSIIAAILALLSGRIVSLILHIVSCVYISKVRNTPMQAAPMYPQNPSYPA